MEHNQGESPGLKYNMFQKFVGMDFFVKYHLYKVFNNDFTHGKWTTCFGGYLHPLKTLINF